jgi:hypothetical protein
MRYVREARISWSSLVPNGLDNGRILRLGCRDPAQGPIGTLPGQSRAPMGADGLPPR